METRVAEVADGTYQLTTYLEEMDFGVNQYLLTGEQPLLFHTGMRGLFPLVAEAAARVLPLESLRWIGFGHVEADECGAVNEWLAVAPSATVVHGSVGCMVSIGDLADRPPRPLAPGEELDLGDHRVEWIDTPHVPHAWEAGVLFDRTAGTLFCGDLFSCYGDYAPTTADDIVTPAIEAEDGFPSMSLHPATGDVIRRLADLAPNRLALMHGPVFTGDCRDALRRLAADADRRTAEHGCVHDTVTRWSARAL
jgi:flavorubredoxin